ncbi:hypothetical protein SESBI_09054 [Sesbania bispinosa]|nr:hypothetical protein SESBI_09054 [Sesbania bispinosa]
MKINPKKYIFAVSSGKFLGFRVHKDGVSAEDTKTEAIIGLKPATSIKETQQLMGKLGDTFGASYLHWES